MIREVTIDEMKKILRDIGINLDGWSEEDLKTLKAEIYNSAEPEEFENAVKFHFKPEEFKELLKKAGSERHTAIKIVERIYKG